MKYRLLALDLDGTTVPHPIDGSRPHPGVRPRVRAAVQAAQARGIVVTLATGRNLTSVLPFASELNISAPLICYQGGQLVEPATGEVFYQVTMPRSCAIEGIRLAEAAGWHLVLFMPQGVYFRELVRSLDTYAGWFGQPLFQTDDLSGEVTSDPMKFLLVDEPPACDGIETELSARFAGRLQIVRSSPVLVEASPFGVTKGRALAALAEELGISQQAVVAIGDGDNDVPMVEWAGLGVAMANGSARVKQVANLIAPSVEEDGVATVIEQVLLA